MSNTGMPKDGSHRENWSWTVEEAITSSVSHYKAVTIDFNAEDQATLLAECESSEALDSGNFHQYRGTTEEGDPWRVIMRAPPKGS
jgi:hypothetical protein